MPQIRVKRKIILENLYAISLSRFGDEFVLHVNKEYDYRYISKDFRKEIIECLCYAKYDYKNKN